MGVEPIGILTLGLGFICLSMGHERGVVVFITLTVLGSAAAILVGSANVQPAHLFLLFLSISTFSHPKRVSMAVRALRCPQPGFWLACLVFYGIATGYFAPRLLARMSEIVPLGAPYFPSTDGISPLGPVSSNFTQAVYLSADLLAFLLVSAIAATKSGFRAVVIGLMAFAFANAAFGLLDMVTHGTSGQDLFAFIRNAQYTFHENEEVAGIRRVVGSWPEASALAGISLGPLGFTGTMLICGRLRLWSSVLFATSVFLVLRSTSSAGLVALPICLLLLYLTALSRSGAGVGKSTSNGIVLLTPLALIVAGLILALDEALYWRIYDYVDLLLFSKATSDSGLTRSAWNYYGYRNFLDSFGLGVGLGTVRTSSFLVALLANVGIPGTLFFGLFTMMSLMKKRDSVATFESDSRAASRNGCLCLLVGAFIVGPTVDLGLLFFVFAGLVSSSIQDDPIAAPVKYQPRSLARVAATSKDTLSS